MSQVTGRTSNVNDTATVASAIVLSNTTTTTIAAANPKRMYFYVDHAGSNMSVRVKLQAASVDDDKKGIFLSSSEKGRIHWEMQSDNIYTGEISAIADNGTPIIFVTEY